MLCWLHLCSQAQRPLSAHWTGARHPRRCAALLCVKPRHHTDSTTPHRWQLSLFASAARRCSWAIQTHFRSWHGVQTTRSCSLAATTGCSSSGRRLPRAPTLPSIGAIPSPNLAPHRYQVSTGECVRTFSKHTDNVTACAWLPDGAGLDSSCAPCLHPSLVPG